MRETSESLSLVAPEGIGLGTSCTMEVGLGLRPETRLELWLGVEARVMVGEGLLLLLLSDSAQRSGGVVPHEAK